MKSKEELNELKEEFEALNKKLAELTEEELAQVTGGFGLAIHGGKQLGFELLVHTYDGPELRD